MGRRREGGLVTVGEEDMEEATPNEELRRDWLYIINILTEASVPKQFKISWYYINLLD